MTDLWPADLKPSSQKSPSSIVGDQNSFISAHTGGHINLIVREVTDQRQGIWALLSNDFSYKADIVAPHLDNFTYNLFEITHPLLLYPVRVLPSLAIKSELGISEFVVAQNEGEFITLFRNILGTRAVRDAIERIWGLSRNRVGG